MEPIPIHGLKGSRIVVTGAGGFLGSHMVRRLARMGADVVGVDIAPGRLDAYAAGLPFTFRQCDLTQAEKAVAAIAEYQPRILIHLACHPDGQEKFDQVRAAIDRNVSLTLHALEGFRAGECGELFIYGDSTKVYGDCDGPYRSSLQPKPLSSYAVGKLAGWEFCQYYRRLHGIAAASIRPTMIYGPGQAMNLFHFVIQSLLAGKEEVVISGGSQTRDPLFIDDAIDAYIAAAIGGQAHDGRIFTIGGGREYSVRELAETTVRVMGRSARISAAAALRRATEMDRSWCDNSEATVALGWAPRHDLESGLLRTLEAYDSALPLPLAAAKGR